MIGETPEWDALLTRAEDLPDGPAKIALCEQAVALADSANDDGGSVRTRLALTTAASFGGAPDVMLVAFVWLLARHDKSPHDSVAAFELLWRYKWVLAAVVEFPDYSVAQCEALLDDLTRRFQAHGAPRHASLACEFRLAWSLGDRPRTVALAARLRRLRPGLLSNCPACLASGQVSYQDWLGRPARAVAAAAPILAGQLSCHAVPRSTYAHLLAPLWQLGRLDEAMRLHKLGYRLIAGVPGCVDDHADHAKFLALTGNLPRAAKLLGTHLPAALQSRSPHDRLSALWGYRVVLHLLRSAGGKTLTLKLPAGHPLHREGGRVALSDISDAVETEARDLARRFDARNANTLWTDDLDPSLQLRPKPYPYTATG